MSCIGGPWAGHSLGIGASVGCATPACEVGDTCQASHFLLLQMGAWQTFPWGLKLGSKLDGSHS